MRNHPPLPTTASCVNVRVARFQYLVIVSKALRSYLRKGQMEVFDAEMWAIGMMDQQRSTSIMRSRHRDGDTRASLGMRKRINNQM